MDGVELRVYTIIVDEEAKIDIEPSQTKTMTGLNLPNISFTTKTKMMPNTHEYVIRKTRITHLYATERMLTKKNNVVAL